MPNRGHSLTIDHGWQEVAQTALDFVKRFVRQAELAGLDWRATPGPMIERWSGTDLLETADGRRLAYVERGAADGFPVVLNHGTPGPAATIPIRPSTTASV